jgi:hypothetical protein
MEEGGASVVVTLDLAAPVELADFLSTFAGLGAQFERFIRRERPDLEGEVKIYVKEVRKGSIEAELIPLAYNTMITVMDHAQIVSHFGRAMAARLAPLRTPGGRLPDASKTELTQIVDTLAAVAKDPNGKGAFKAVHYTKTGAKTDFQLEFNTAAAQQFTKELEVQYAELDVATDFDHENELLTFFQSNRRDSDKPGDKGIIEAISPKPLAVIYASDLARERIKSEMVGGDRNIYKLGFFVDVNVQHHAGRPVAYRIKAVRDVIELPEDE